MGNNIELKYVKVFDKRKKLVGIKIEGQKGWFVEPSFEELGLSDFCGDNKNKTWFKKNGNYGWYNIEDRIVLITAEYAFPLYFNQNGYAITWKNYKAGVVDIEGNEVIPFVYDNIVSRWQHIDITEDDKVCPTAKDVFRGFVCFTDEGNEQFYDEQCKPSYCQEWEHDRFTNIPKFDNREVENMTIEELEDLIKKEYIRLIELGYEHHHKWVMSKEHNDLIRAQEYKVESLIRDRRMMMNRSWVHNRENAERIGRLNNLLMRAVHKGIKLAKRTSRSLQWMQKTPNSECYEVEVYIYPYWQNSKSDLRYECRFKSSVKEQERLIDDEDNVSETHIWNIIADLGKGYKRLCKASCFEESFDDYEHDDWNERRMIGDDGQTWDECIHFPAYQDVYFTRPFHHLYLDLFDYSFEDLCNINDFRVNINVRLQTREQDKA